MGRLPPEDITCFLFLGIFFTRNIKIQRELIDGPYTENGKFRLVIDFWFWVLKVKSLKVGKKRG